MYHQMTAVLAVESCYTPVVRYSLHVQVVVVGVLSPSYAGPSMHLRT